MLILWLAFVKLN